jgi:hypothetical protein
MASSSSIWSPTRSASAAFFSRLLCPDHERGGVLLTDLEAASAFAPTTSGTTSPPRSTRTALVEPQLPSTVAAEKLRKIREDGQMEMQMHR